MGQESAERWFTVLNGVGVRYAGHWVSLGPPQRQALLCGLLFRRGHWVPAATLLSGLYDGEPPSSGVAVVQTHISALRRVLEPDRKPKTPATVLLSSHRGYRLQVTDDQVDLGLFDRVIADADQARKSGDWPSAQRHYAQALDLFSGEPLAGIPGPYAARQRSALIERRLAVVEDSLDVDISAGQRDQAIDRLRDIVDEHPLRERPRVLLMRALYGGGRQSEALDVYAATRRLLVDQLGVEPGAELRALHGQILAGDPLFDRETAAPIRAAAPQEPEIVDRDRELTLIAGVLQRAEAGRGGVAVIAGRPGYGKTALLDEVGRQHTATRRVDLSDGPLPDLGAAAGLILVDNLSSADPDVMRELTRLGKRLRDRPALVLVAMDERTLRGDQQDSMIALEAVAAAVIRLGSLTESGAATMAARTLGRSVSPRLRAQIMQVTGGRAAMIAALLNDLAAMPATDSLPPRIEGGCYARTSRHLLHRYPETFQRLLFALGLLHRQRPTMTELAAAVGTSVSVTRECCELLVVAGLLAAVDPPAFHHDLVANTVRSLYPTTRTSEIWVAAARQAQLDGRGAQEVARYLTELRGTEWAQWTGVLVEAAETALAREEVREAVRLLEIALRVCLPEARGQILSRLGQLELLTNMTAAQRYFEEAVEAQRGRGEVPSSVIALGWVTAALGQPEAAIRLIDGVIRETEERRPETLATLRSGTWLVGTSTRRTWQVLLERQRSRMPNPVAEAILLFDDVRRLRCSAAEAVDRFPTRHDVPLQLEGLRAHLTLWCDDLNTAWVLGSQRGDDVFAEIDLWRIMLRAHIRLRRADFQASLNEARLLTTLPPEQPARRPVHLTAEYAQALIHLGRLGEAERWLDTIADTGYPRSWEWPSYLFAMGMLNSARGDIQRAATFFLDCGVRSGDLDVVNPGLLPWRTMAALELAKLGERDKAQRLAAEDLAGAEAWGTPRSLGMAYWATAMTSPAKDRLPLLERAVQELRGAQTRIELPHAMLDLAAELVRSGQVRYARTVLHEVQALAGESGALPLLDRTAAMLQDMVVPDAQDSALVERDGQLSRIGDLLGGAGLVLITGQAGFGRTALLDEVARRHRPALRVDLLTSELPELGPDTGLVLIDNAVSTDEPLLTALASLATRMRGSSTLVLAAVEDRNSAASGSAPLLALETTAVATVRLSALSVTGIAELAARTFGTPCSAEFATRLRQATAGIPSVLTALLSDLGTPPADQRLPARIEHSGYERALRDVLERYQPDSTLVMTTLGVLHDRAPTMSELAAATGLAPSVVRDRCEAFLGFGILSTVDPPRYAQALLTNTCRALCPQERRPAIQVAAARQAQMEGQNARRIARYLTELIGAEWAQWTVVLRAAAEQAVREHDHRAAIGYLEAALRICLPADRGSLLLRLGQLEQLTNLMSAQLHLGQALAAQREAGVAPTAAAPLAWTLGNQGQSEAAWQLLTEVIAETSGETKDALRASSWLVAFSAPENWQRLVHQQRELPADPITEGILLLDDVLQLRCSAGEAMQRFPEQAPRRLLGLRAHIAVWCDELTSAWHLGSLREDESYAEIDLWRSVMRSNVLLSRGDFTGALAETQMLAATPAEQPVRRSVLLIVRHAHALLSVGRIDEAERWLDAVVENGSPLSWDWASYLIIRAYALSLRGRRREAVDHLLDCGRRVANWGIANPALFPWRTMAVGQLIELGDREQARRLAAEELAAGEKWGTHRHLGLGWWATGLAETGPDRLPALERGVRELRAAQTQHELPHAILDLSQELRADDPQRARELLHEVIAGAEANGALPLLHRATELLTELP
ncbi:hypothetical protein D5S17_21140 [Pseudonocardiaceae bacterium YIM PH 21723]|nr:hypothetical protein D5S17_21140 [Pseudonocardiaceae bacterium YIM PH 21723]